MSSKNLGIEDLDAESGESGRPGSPVDPRRLVAIARRSWRWVFGTALVLGVVGVLVAKLAIGRSYMTSASLQYGGLAGQPVHEQQRDLPSLVAVAHSEPILLRVRDLRGLHGVHIDAMRAMIGVQSDATTGMVTFTAYGSSPEEAAALANGTVQVFLDHHRQRRRHELAADKASLEERVEAASGEHQLARQTYDAFRAANGITDLTAEQEQVISQAATLRSQADLALAEMEAVEARVAQVREALETTPRTLAVPVGQSRQASRLGELQQRLREARGQGLGESHPQIQALERQVASLERGAGVPSGATRMGVNSVHEQLRATLVASEAELESMRTRHESLEQLATAAQERSNRFSDIEGQAASLLAQVNVKAQLVEDLTAQMARTDDQLRDVPTGFRLVSAAVPPEVAVKSKKKIAVALGLPVGGVFLVLLAFFLADLRRFRVRTAAEVAFWGDAPVVGMSTWPRLRAGWYDLVADIEELTAGMEGTLLVVGVSEQEHMFAKQLAAELNRDHDSFLLEDTSLGLLAADALTLPRAGGSHFGERSTFPEFGPPVNVVEEDVAATDPDGGRQLVCVTWSDFTGTQSLRRAARRATAVLVLVPSDEVKATALAAVKKRLGRTDGVGYFLLSIPDEDTHLPDRVGPIERFARSYAAG